MGNIWWRKPVQSDSASDIQLEPTLTFEGSFDDNVFPEYDNTTTIPELFEYENGAPVSIFFEDNVETYVSHSIFWLRSADPGT